MANNPSIKQKKALAIMVENGGNVSKAMREAGYSPKTAKNPNKLTSSKKFNFLLDKYLPNSLLLEKHQQLLNKQEVIARNNIKSGEIEIIPTGEIDAQAVKSGLDMAYKLKGSYAAEKHEITVPKPILDLPDDNVKQNVQEN